MKKGKRANFNTTGYLILDIGKGRKGLARMIESGRNVRVTIEATINSRYGADDGVSIEFSASDAKIIDTEWLDD